MEIAVLVGNDGRTISFDDVGLVKVYYKDKGGWKIKKELPFCMNNLMTPKAIREGIMSMIDSLEQCKVFAAVEVKGIAFTILEGMKFNIWKVSGLPEDFLEYIYEKEQQLRMDKFVVEEVPKPSKIDDSGKYFIDLKAIMEKNENITSKQVLLPFLDNTTFVSLEISCTHVPPWFNKEFGKLGFKSIIEQKSIDDFKVTIYPREK